MSSIDSGEHLQKLIETYRNNKPFPHICLEDFIDPDKLIDVVKEFPPPSDNWWKYENLLEKKFTKDDIHSFPPLLKQLICELQADNRWISFLEKLTGIHGLIPDPGLNGGGLHQILPGGKLDIHADYNYHPKTKLDRRLNVILYLNEGWKEEWGGHLEFWNKDMTECVQKIAPIFNRLVIFNVNDWAYHGHPDPLACPEGMSRKSIALYYYTNGRPGEEVTPPHSVIFKKRPQDADDEQTQALREQRKKGRL